MRGEGEGHSEEGGPEAVFVKVRRAFTVGAVLLLLFLFIVPSLYLGAQCAALDQLTDRVLSGDQAAYEALTKRYEAMRRRAELFLDHRVMDDATVPLKLMGVYLDVDDSPALLAAATEFRQALACMLALSHTVAGICRGGGKATVPMLVMLGVWCVFRIAYITAAMHFCHDIRLLFWAYPITWTISGAILRSAWGSTTSRTAWR